MKGADMPGGASILVVDDTEQIRELLQAVLTKEGYVVRTAADGEAGLAAVREDPPDLVLLDVMMPRMDGFEVCRCLRADPETALVPVLMLTAKSERQTLVDGLDAGADDFLRKPFDRVELLARVRSLLRVKQLTDRLDRANDVLLALARALEARDGYTEGHTERVAEYAVALGRESGLDEESLWILHRGAVIHDLGKIGVPDSILNKPGRLTAEEFEEIKKHPAIGEAICASLRSIRAMLPMIRSHQEKFDGTGYPDGLAGNAIPLEARIIAVVDAYDAMTTDRPYRKGMSTGEAIAELRRCAGTQWDSELVDRFIGMLEREGTGEASGVA